MRSRTARSRDSGSATPCTRGVCYQPLAGETACSQPPMTWTLARWRWSTCMARASATTEHHVDVLSVRAYPCPHHPDAFPSEARIGGDTTRLGPPPLSRRPPGPAREAGEASLMCHKRHPPGRGNDRRTVRAGAFGRDHARNALASPHAASSSSSSSSPPGRYVQAAAPRPGSGASSGQHPSIGASAYTSVAIRGRRRWRSCPIAASGGQPPR